MKPLIYVAAVRRTGSTMMAELLSEPPHCFVFREPRLPNGRLILKEPARELLEAHGLAPKAVSKRMARLPRADAIACFRDFVREAADRVHQLGVKEILHEGWEAVADAFPDMKVVVTVRDPRDVWLSMWHKRDRLERRGRAWTDPEALAEDVNRESARLSAIAERLPHVVVRYEDFCRRPAMIDDVRRFTECDVRGAGLLGRTSDWNLDRHGHAIDDSRVELWRRETDPAVRAGCARAFECMAPYAERWGYR